MPEYIARCIAVFVGVIGMIIVSVMYNHFTNAHKEKCLSKFKTIEYEIVSDVLYCKADDGLVEFGKVE